MTYTYVSDERRLGALRQVRSAFFRRLEQDGHLCACGQLSGEAMPRGLPVIDAADIDEATRLVDDDSSSTTVSSRVDKSDGGTPPSAREPPARRAAGFESCCRSLVARPRIRSSSWRPRTRHHLPMAFDFR